MSRRQWQGRSIDAAVVNNMGGGCSGGAIKEEAEGILPGIARGGDTTSRRRHLLIFFFPSNRHGSTKRIATRHYYEPVLRTSYGTSRGTTASQDQLRGTRTRIAQMQIYYHRAQFELRQGHV